MANSIRKNTVKLVFGPDSRIPSHLDVLKFSMDVLKLSAADIHSIYKDENGGQFYIKLLDEPTFSAFISETIEAYNFQYDDGTTARVQVDQASQIFRYVRIFNLPPEIEDRDIQYVLGQYGSIRQHVRERFPSEINVNIFTGVRGVHMEVSKEIPANIYVGHFRARIFYEGLKGRCFFCKAEGHMKAECPKLAAVPPGNGAESNRPGSSGVSQSKPKPSGGSANPAGRSGTQLGRPNKPVVDNSIPVIPQMTVLKKNGDSNVQNPGSQKATTTPTIPKDRTGTTTDDAAYATDTGTDEIAIAMEDEISEQQRCTTIKRPGGPVVESSESEEVANDDVAVNKQAIATDKTKGKKQIPQMVSRLPRNKKYKQ